MTGPEHYAAAEQLLADGRAVVSAIRATPPDQPERRDGLGKQAMGIWAQSQVHATLALAAATAFMTGDQPALADHDAWREVTS